MTSRAHAAPRGADSRFLKSSGRGDGGNAGRIAQKTGSRHEKTKDRRAACQRFANGMRRRAHTGGV